MKLTLDRSVWHDFDGAVSREWLDTNGLGGYASSTIAGAHTRRYHGLLVAALRPPTDRVVLLSRLDETIVVGDRTYDLGCNFYPGAIHPNGYELLTRFEQTAFPTFDFVAGDIKIRKTIGLLDGENTVVVSYDVLDAPGPFTMRLNPLIAARSYHALTRANSSLDRECRWSHDSFDATPYPGMPVSLRIPGATFVPAAAWYYNVDYPLENQRGFDHREDLFSYGSFEVSLTRGGHLAVIASTEPTRGRDGTALLERERRRRIDEERRTGFTRPVVRILDRAAQQFLVRRANDRRTILAGYHWFTDWGRDTMIALPGICLVSRRFDEARKILAVFAEHCDQGMLPNRFPDDPTERPEYNSVDATLWFFIAVYRYLESSGDVAFVRDTLWAVLRDIIRWHKEGTRFDIAVDVDGLIRAGNPTTQLTWMDAKIGDWVVTPRCGKAVEVNALWYNALMIAAQLADRFGAAGESDEFRRAADRAYRAFGETFWNKETGCLFDCVDGDYRDGSIRPNQLLALALPFPVIDEERARSVLKVVEEKLYTPVGLRSLDPAHPSYQPHYSGGPHSRDGAYHQGTVWSWLLGPFITALVRYREAAGRRRAAEVLALFEPHLLEAGIGTVSEIFDAEPPHTPRGCIAQAWGVAEILRAIIENDIGTAPSRGTATPLTEGSLDTPKSTGISSYFSWLRK